MENKTIIRTIGETKAGNPIVTIRYGFGDLRHYIEVGGDLFDLDEAGLWFVQGESSDGIRESVCGFKTTDKREAETLAENMRADGHDVWVKQI